MFNKLSPTGTGGMVLPNGSMTTNAGNEEEIRKKLISEGLVDCVERLLSENYGKEIWDELISTTLIWQLNCHLPKYIRIGVTH